MKKSVALAVYWAAAVGCEMVCALVLTFIANRYDVRYMGQVTLAVWVLIVVTMLQIKVPIAKLQRLALLIPTMPVAAIGWFVMMRHCFLLLPK